MTAESMQVAMDAFPVGTGIYRLINRSASDSVSVPCGYRDIPKKLSLLDMILKRSLWVQGYTGDEIAAFEKYLAFPVGTGIYRVPPTNSF